jgi:hypothetical protein
MRTLAPQQPQKDFLGALSLRGKVRQTQVRESSGFIENIWLKIAFEIDHALTQGSPSPGLGATFVPPHSLIIG